VAEHTFQCAVGDRSTPLSVRLWERGRDNNIASLVVNFAMFTDAGAVKTAETATGVTVMPGQTFTADTTNARYGCNGHGLEDGWEVVLSTVTTLPAPLATTTRYFIRDATQNHFKLCTEPNGAAVAPTNTGTGAHTIKAYGHVQYAWTALDVGTAGTFSARLIVIDASGYRRTFPETLAPGIAVIVNTAA
jgi:hypothetical protein